MGAALKMEDESADHSKHEGQSRRSECDDGGEEATGGGEAMPQAYKKSPESLERDVLMHNNFVKYIGYSDEELTPILPTRPDGRPTSIGAVLHALGKCKACVHNLMPKGCCHGIRCKF